MEAEEHWDDIGIQLQIVDETLEDIGSESLLHEGSFQRMVRAWMKQEKLQPSWLNFVEALEHLKVCKNLSAHLRSKYCKLHVTVIVYQIKLSLPSTVNIPNFDPHTSSSVLFIMKFGIEQVLRVSISLRGVISSYGWYIML